MTTAKLNAKPKINDSRSSPRFSSVITPPFYTWVPTWDLRPVWRSSAITSPSSLHSHGSWPHPSSWYTPITPHRTSQREEKCNWVWFSKQTWCHLVALYLHPAERPSLVKPDSSTGCPSLDGLVLPVIIWSSLVTCHFYTSVPPCGTQDWCGVQVMIISTQITSLIPFPPSRPNLIIHILC